MITEIVEFEVKPGTADAFASGVGKSEVIFARAPGFISLQLHRTTENPLIFIMLIKWETVAHHMDMFQKSPDFSLWRGNVGQFFAKPPRLQHTETLLSY